MPSARRIVTKEQSWLVPILSSRPREALAGERVLELVSCRFKHALTVDRLRPYFSAPPSSTEIRGQISLRQTRTLK